MKAKASLLCSVLAILGGCSSVQVEPGPPMNQIWEEGAGNGRATVDDLRRGINIDETSVASAPVRPMVNAPVVLPIYERGRLISENIRTDGRWIYEIVEPGGFVDQ